jgi:cell division protease FtsH
MSPTETDMLDQPSKDAEKAGWRFLKLLGYGEAPSAGPRKGKTESRTPKEPEERKHQFATWYVFAAFLGVMLVQFLWLRFTQVDTIPYSQFEQLVEENKIAEVLVGQETVQGILKEPFPDGRKMFYTVRVEPELADKLRAHGVVITGAPSSTFLSTILSWVLPIFIFYLIWTYGFRRVAERQGLGGLMSIGKSRAKVYVETDTKTTFRDVAGVDEATFELQEVVAFLRDPTSFGLQPKRFELSTPFRRSVAQSLDVDASRQTALGRSADELEGKESERDGHIDMTDAASLAQSNLLSVSDGS